MITITLVEFLDLIDKNNIVVENQDGIFALNDIEDFSADVKCIDYAMDSINEKMFLIVKTETNSKVEGI